MCCSFIVDTARVQAVLSRLVEWCSSADKPIGSYGLRCSGYHAEVVCVCVSPASVMLHSCVGLPTAVIAPHPHPDPPPCTHTQVVLGFCAFISGLMLCCRVCEMVCLLDQFLIPLHCFTVLGAHVAHTHTHLLPRAPSTTNTPTLTRLQQNHKPLCQR